jgi:hypothetical protein
MCICIDHKGPLEFSWYRSNTPTPVVYQYCVEWRMERMSRAVDDTSILGAPIGTLTYPVLLPHFIWSICSAICPACSRAGAMFSIDNTVTKVGPMGQYLWDRVYSFSGTWTWELIISTFPCRVLSWHNQTKSQTCKCFKSCRLAQSQMCFLRNEPNPKALYLLFLILLATKNRQY